MPSLYRKWRSRSFDDVVGQDHVVRTLRNAVARGRVAHAYLFTGPRGTGKTSTARILAKAVNCLNPQDGNPCNECALCVAADEGRALDVIEIDAASNTSVEHVRDLRERVAYAPGEGTHKVYIVDEVHRLSGAAFDAFLKTLEEPPPHVLFVFASTEPHKVPETIRSRCQRFDFRRIPPSETAARLRHVAAEEGVRVDDGAVQLITQQAHGSLRDALGLLDQLVAYSGMDIGSDDVRATLGLGDPTLLSRLTDSLLAGEAGRGLNALREFSRSGGDARELLAQMVGYWRALLLVVTRTPGVEDIVDPALADAVRRHAEQLHEGTVLGVLRAFTEQQFGAKVNVPEELPFEVAFVQAILTVQSAGRPRTERPASPPTAATPAPEPSTSPSVDTPLPPAQPAPPREPPPPRQEPVSLRDVLNPPASAPANGSAAQEAPTPSPDGALTMVELEQAWPQVIAAMRSRSPSLQAVLRSGYALKVENGEITVGFVYPFHAQQFADKEKRRHLEGAVADVLGVSYRVSSVLTTPDEVKALRGADAIVEDDGFVDEVADRLREFHARQLGNADS